MRFNNGINDVIIGGYRAPVVGWTRPAPGIQHNPQYHSHRTAPSICYNNIINNMLALIVAFMISKNLSIKV
jgi:hypothetical protein